MGGERGAAALRMPSPLSREAQEGGTSLGRTHISALKYSTESQCVEEGLQNSRDKFIVDDQIAKSVGER